LFLKKGKARTSVAHPDPEDPDVLGPPESGSQRYGSGSFYHQEKIVRKTLIPTVCDSVVDPDPGSGSVLDPYSIGSVDPDPYSESGSGSRRAKMTHKSRQ
jgi:hypothetical protein